MKHQPIIQDATDKIGIILSDVFKHNRDQIEILVAENNYLKGLLVARTKHLPGRWRLAPKQKMIMGALLNHDKVRMSHMIELIYGEDEPKTAEVSVRVMIHSMRKKLAVDNILIHDPRSDGYYLEPYRKQIVLQHLERKEVA